MPNRLADAVSPYLRSHAGNPVDWQPWGEAAFAEARERDVPVMVSIGYSTCHWCHVMARESFSDEVVAARLNDEFVAIKVDREEHPDVDSSYLAAASAFTQNLGWPLTVFVTPDGRAFYAGTYFPPVPVQGVPSFTQVLDAVHDAWSNRRDEVQQNAAQIASALAAQQTGAAGSRLSRPDVTRIAADLARFEDAEHGGFGAAPKFPVAPVQLLLLEVAALGGDSASEAAADGARALVERTLLAMAASPLRDDVEGGFFRYAVRRDWHEPHYERMLYDNAQLLRAYSRLSALPGVEPGTPARAQEVTEGVASFLLDVLRVGGGAFGSAQDSESDLGEGGYYALDAAERKTATPPAVDDKVLTGWNGLAIGALAEAGARHARRDWVTGAQEATRAILGSNVAPDGTLLRASSSRGTSAAVATLEDFGMLAEGLLRLAIATGESEWAVRARDLVDACLVPGGVFRAPGGGDPVLAGQGLALASDPSEGAYPSGLSAMASAALLLSQLGAGGRYREAAESAVDAVADRARDNPIAFGATLAVGLALADAATQLVVVEPDEPAGSRELASFAHSRFGPGLVSVAVSTSQATEWSEAGFELFEGRSLVGATPTAYLCHDFVCRLPVTTPDALAAQLA